jgi:hypothetical protein
MDWPRVLDEAYQGDPFRMLVEFDGQRYVFDEAALIEASERAFQAWRWTDSAALTPQNPPVKASKGAYYRGLAPGKGTGNLAPHPPRA